MLGTPALHDSCESATKRIVDRPLLRHGVGAIRDDRLGVRAAVRPARAGAELTLERGLATAWGIGQLWQTWATDFSA